MSGVRVEWNNKMYHCDTNDTLLNNLLKQGALIHHGCQAGNCHACALHDVDSDETLLTCQTACDRSRRLMTLPIRRWVSVKILHIEWITAESVELTLACDRDHGFCQPVMCDLLRSTDLGVAHENESLQCRGVVTVLPEAQLKILFNLSNQKNLISLLKGAWQSGTELHINMSNGLKDRSYFRPQDILLEHNPVCVYLFNLGLQSKGSWCKWLERQNVSDYEVVLINQEDLNEQEVIIKHLEERRQSSYEVQNAQFIIQNSACSLQQWYDLFRSYRIRPSRVHVFY